MKVYQNEKNNKQQALLLIFIICSCSLIKASNSSLINSWNKINKFSREISGMDGSNNSPSEILRFTEIDKNDKRLNMEISENDPLKYLALKQEIVELYSGGKKSAVRFKQNPDNSSPLPERISNNFNTSSEGIKPFEIGRIGSPTQKTYSSDQVVVPIVSTAADSVYIQHGINKEIINKFESSNVLQSDKFWCSAGNHDVKTEVKFFVEFSKSYSLTSMWLHWAFAPGEFRIKYSNDKKQWDDLLGGYRLSIKNGDVNWWRSILLNPKTRWQYKSFDEKINFDEPFFARYIELSMRIPVNQYFGIFSLEFYTKSKSLVMLKSKASGQNACLSVANGMMTNLSPAYGVNCLQAISYGDNRDLWILNSNGYITTHKFNKCLQSAKEEEINIIDCGLASDFKDDREKWIIDYDGKIRSMKEQFTCLTLTDHSFGDSLLPSELKVSATSREASGNHNPDNALDMNSTTYWASNPSLQDVIYEIYFHKYSLFVKRLTIDWKFPAKSFIVLGMLTDGFWKVFFNSAENRQTRMDINFNNYDLLGIKIIMKESTTKFDQKNIYGITNLSVHSGASFLRREPCTKILGGGNLWEIIYVNEVEDVTGEQYKKAWAELHVTRNKFDNLKNFYMKIPDTLINMKQSAVEIDKRIMRLQSSFDDIEKFLSRFEDFLHKDQMKELTLAINEYFPSYDCAHIIRSFPNKRSGYYWIKNECMHKPLRVYCDFDSYDKKAGLDYYVFNEDQSINNVMSGVKNLNDVRLACNKLGLEPIELKNYKMLRLVLRIIKEAKFNFNPQSDAFIPLGYDYSCDHASCSKLFRSFNDEKASDLNDIFAIYAKDDGSDVFSNIFNSSNINEDSMKNTAGIAANYKINYGKLSKKKVVALVCSTNKDGSKRGTEYQSLDCESNIRGDTYRKLEIFSHLRFVCPRECSLSKAAIYGSNIYTDNSSICKAAIHSGVIKDAEGGIVELGVEPGRSNYNGSNAHGIDTLDYTDKWDRSFKVSRYHPYCPIEKIKNYAQAMGVSFSSFISFSEKNNLIEDLKSKIVNQLNYMVKNNNFSENDNRLKKLQLASELLKFVQKNDMENASSEELKNNLNSIKSNLNISSDPSNNLYVPTSNITTDEALVSITAINNKDVKLVDMYTKIANAFKSLIGKSGNELQNLLTDKHTGLESLKIKFNSYDSKLESIKRLIYEIDVKSQIQLKKSEHRLSQLKSDFSKNQLRENFQEDYNSANILENYEIFNSKKGNGELAKWEYYMYNLDGHFKTIKQTGEFRDNRTGSHLVIKNRDFYDFELKFSVQIKGSKTFGICFRYANSFNYYIFEISNEGKGFKRLRKFLRGEAKTIDIKYDGGYVQNTWYHFKIHGEQSKFKIYMTTDSSSSMRDHYDLVFQFVDNELVHGTFAFASYGLPSLMIDNISIVHLSCTEPTNRASDNENVLTPDCPRYFEQLKSLFKYMWNKVDPLETTGGPSNWKVMHKVDGRERVLAQTSLIKGLSPNEDGTIMLLNQQTKVCSRGKISIKFKAMDSGIVSIIFRYEKERNSYYLLEVSESKFIRLRRKVGNVYTLLSVRQLLGFSKDKWIKLVVLMNDNKFNAYVSDENGLEGNLVKVFENDIFDNEIKLGLFGLSTYQTRAFFDEITLGTIEDEVSIDINNLDNVENKLFVERHLLPLPKTKIPKKMFDRLNLHIENYSWGRCVKYSSPNEKVKLCDIIFKSPNEIHKCQTNFCDSCCEKSTDNTNKHYKYLCKKQCNMLDDANEVNKSWKSCYQPTTPDKSIYPYCENLFGKKYYQTSRCKVDMCNLCCASFDFTSRSKISKLNLQSCYKGCIKSFDKQPDIQ